MSVNEQLCTYRELEWQRDRQRAKRERIINYPFHSVTYTQKFNGWKESVELRGHPLDGSKMLYAK